MSRAMQWKIDIDGIEPGEEVEKFLERVNDDGLVGVVESHSYFINDEFIFSADADCSLVGGQTAEEKAAEVAAFIQKTLGRKVRVEITAFFVEDTPTETYIFEWASS